MATKNIGKITQVIGAVLDVKYSESNLPKINEAIEVTIQLCRQADHATRDRARETRRKREGISGDRACSNPLRFPLFFL